MIDWEAWLDPDQINEQLWNMEFDGANTKWAFADESGAFRSQQYFVLGMVLTPDMEQTERDTAAICARHRLDGEVKFSDMRRYTVPVACDLLDYFADSPELEFQCIYKQKGIYDLRRYTNEDGVPRQDLAYNHTYRRFLEFKLNCSRADVVIDQRSRSANDNLLDYLYREVPQIANIREESSRDYRTLQLTDLLVGAVNSELTGNGNDHKIAVRSRILSRLGITTVTENRRDDKFGIWKWRPPMK